MIYTSVHLVSQKSLCIVFVLCITKNIRSKFMVLVDLVLALLDDGDLGIIVLLLLLV